MDLAYGYTGEVSSPFYGQEHTVNSHFRQSTALQN